MMKNPKSRALKYKEEVNSVTWGTHLTYQAIHSPRRMLHMMSYYKFASRLIGSSKSVLDVGCGEGLGTWLLSTECGYARGIDLDNEAIEVGSQNWKDPRISFECIDLQLLKGQLYDAVVSFDVIEHITKENTPDFFQKIVDSIVHNGIAIIGTPNINSDQYSSEITRAGHVNLYSGEALEKTMRLNFSHVFMFGANDEIIHTGFLPMAHYLIAVGCQKRFV